MDEGHCARPAVGDAAVDEGPVEPAPRRAGQPAVLGEERLAAVDFLAADFLAGDFLAAAFLAGDFLAAAFLAVDFLAGDFLAADFFAVDFLAADFFVAARPASAVRPMTEATCLARS
ncbi:MAG: hypothetical protein ACRDYE_02815 [Acidimicrobiales bacterium]